MRISYLAILPLLVVSAAAQSSPVTVTAKALNAAPGAIVCHDMATVSAMFDLYSESWGEHMQSALTNRQSELVDGRPMPPPNLARYGCVLAKPGTRMTLNSGAIPPIVSFKLANGKIFTGVTFPDMYVTPGNYQKASPPSSPAPPLPAVPQIQPNATTTAGGPVPGALVCQDLNSLVIAYKAFDRHDEAEEKESLSYGCTLLSPRTKIQIRASGRTDMVQAIINGKIITGQTFPSMVVSN